jgi:hypothetical protein
MKIIHQTKALTPLELYKQQVNNVIQAARNEGSAIQSIPAQFGGIFGQRAALAETLSITLVSIDGGTA